MWSVENVKPLMWGTRHWSALDKRVLPLDISKTVYGQRYRAQSL